ncbi:hypothetical protein CRG98_009559 [Punica granatum]|uniref:Uncharacterized protein n=1 Tax=Punica granatum TaxID=22663 RepID=A0A2I0KQL1_PUNGR|nr:hypothetical protein CRG98_009559 [Punica granatum]
MTSMGSKRLLRRGTPQCTIGNKEEEEEGCCDLRRCHQHSPRYRSEGRQPRKIGDLQLTWWILHSNPRPSLFKEGRLAERATAPTTTLLTAMSSLLFASLNHPRNGKSGEGRRKGEDPLGSRYRVAPAS